MSNRNHPLAHVLFGCLLLAACNDESPESQPEDDTQADGGRPGRADGGVSNDADGGADENTADAGKPRVDGGVSRPDGSVQPVQEDARFFLSTGDKGDNVSPPTVVLDRDDNAHFVYPAYAGGGAYYAYCANGACSHSSDMEVVKFDTTGTAYNAMIALTRDGKPRVLLSAFTKIYYGECDADCGDAANWSMDAILDHGNKKEVTGHAFTLDEKGRPRFVIHTYRALFGIGQETPQTELYACDADCSEAAHWSASQLSEQIWYGSTLRYDRTGAVHISTTECDYEGLSPSTETLAYFLCKGGACNTGDDFVGIGFGKPYESMTEALDMKFAIDLELTKALRPRVALIVGTDVQGEKALAYGECLDGKECTDSDAWGFYAVSKHAKIGPGVDLTLDANDHPHLAYTFNYNILQQTCSANCTDSKARERSWDDDILIEAADSLPADDIFLWPNCNVGAWLLGNPSVALTKDGSVRAAYEARDISGSLGTADPSQPACTAGTDMVLGRAAFLHK